MISIDPKLSLTDIKSSFGHLFDRKSLYSANLPNQNIKNACTLINMAFRWLCWWLYVIGTLTHFSPVQEYFFFKGLKVNMCS